MNLNSAGYDSRYEKCEENLYDAAKVCRQAF